MAKVGAVVIVRKVVCTVPLWSSISNAADAVSVAVAIAIAIVIAISVTIADVAVVAVVGSGMVGWGRWGHVAETGDALGDVR